MAFSAKHPECVHVYMAHVLQVGESDAYLRYMKRLQNCENIYSLPEDGDFGKATFADKPQWGKCNLKTKEEIQEIARWSPLDRPELLEGRVLHHFNSGLKHSYLIMSISMSVKVI